MKIFQIQIIFYCFFSQSIYLAAQADAAPLDKIKTSAPLVLLSNGNTAADIEVIRTWSGSECKVELVNRSAAPQRLKEVVLFTAAHLFAGSTKIYGEGFQMLSQTAGSLDSPVDIGNYTDRKHYRLAEPSGYRVVYNLLSLAPGGETQYLLGFISANRFIGKFYLSPNSIKIVLDLENLEIPPGAHWKGEDFFMQAGPDRSGLFNRFALAIGKRHPRLSMPVGTGWCSWYCFGPEVTPKNISDNLTKIKQATPQLKYIQLDDGYQAHMGDWLTPGPAFDGGIKQILLKIKEQGFEPAIWVAPFICDSNSSVFKLHKDWLVKDSLGNPLRSDKVGFGGWRLAPWYVLDGTNPAVQIHLEQIFSVMRREWGCSYFKLDANYWGTLPGAKYFKPDATRTEAYRSGMTAILKGAGTNSFILGCNHPNWPSLGLIHGARTSGDISRDWETFRSTGKENLYRSWENGKLWWNDPDCLLLTGSLPENEFMYHAALLYSTGGMMLSGDDMTKISPERMPVLKKLTTNTGIAASFDDEFVYGWTRNKKHTTLVVLNSADASRDIHVPLKKPVTLYDFFTGKKLGHFANEILFKNFAGRNGVICLVKNE